jgi:hypothetical protein
VPADRIRKGALCHLGDLAIRRGLKRNAPDGFKVPCQCIGLVALLPKRGTSAIALSAACLSVGTAFEIAKPGITHTTIRIGARRRNCWLLMLCMKKREPSVGSRALVRSSRHGKGWARAFDSKATFVRELPAVIPRSWMRSCGKAFTPAHCRRQPVPSRHPTSRSRCLHVRASASKTARSRVARTTSTC